jgi:hypothetical protein
MLRLSLAFSISGSFFHAWVQHRITRGPQEPSDVNFAFKINFVACRVYTDASLKKRQYRPPWLSLEDQHSPFGSDPF